MRDDEIRSMVEKILDEMLEPSGKEIPEPKRTEVIQTTAGGYHKGENQGDGRCLEDITEINLRSQLLVKEPKDEQSYLAMKAKTPARLGIGLSLIHIC